MPHEAVVTFKYEDDIDGEPIGPVYISVAGEVTNKGWHTLADAHTIASDFDAVLQES